LFQLIAFITFGNPGKIPVVGNMLKIFISSLLLLCQYLMRRYRFGFNGQEKDDEITGSVGVIYAADFWYYDARIARRWNIDPVIKFHESPYAVFSNNPIWFIDPSGADTSKFTGSKNLLIFIQDRKAQIDYAKMVKESGNWDFVVVDNMKGAENLLRSEYGDQAGFIENLVVKSHRSAYTGPDLNTAIGIGVLHNPRGDKSLGYVRSLLTNPANICFTACSIVQWYNHPDREGYKSLRETAKNFSKFFLKGTRRNLFMNYTLSSSTSYSDANLAKAEELLPSYC